MFINSLMTILVGVHLVGEGIIGRAQDKAKTDLNAAREIYVKNLDIIKNLVRLTSERFFLKESLHKGNLQQMKNELLKIREREELDILTITDKHGVVIFRTHNISEYGDSYRDNEIVRHALLSKDVIASTEICDIRRLSKEGKYFAKQKNSDW